MLVRKPIVQKFMMYSLVGCICTCIYFLSMFILVERMGNEPIFSSIISFVLMTIFSFFLNIRFTFGSEYSKQKLVRFFIVATIGFTLNFVIMYSIVQALSFHYLIGEIATTLTIPIVNFFLNHYWTFK
ncbi:GtrA family protein [Robertmurraya korlensis]|uniref:GtrA family protein n=1 Tax=Robertmurraya korlensis TaxID=519977 RepID=UPI0008241FE6|nr:GtrA family protein [Robertmurraya korlensis]